MNFLQPVTALELRQSLLRRRSWRPAAVRLRLTWACTPALGHVLVWLVAWLAVVVVVPSLMLEGRAALILRDQDRSLVVGTKVVTRVAVGVATPGISEAFIEAEKEREPETCSHR